MKQKMDCPTYIIAGIRNKPGRNIATIFCFAFIAANIFSGQYLSAGASGSVDQGISRMGADLAVVPTQYILFLRGAITGDTMAIIRIEPSTTRLNISDMDTLRTVPGIAVMSPQLYVSTMRLPDLSSSPVDIFGIDPETDFTISPWLQRPLRRPLSPGEVIVGNDISGQVSSQITIAGNSYTFAGRLDPTRSAIDRTIFLRMDDAYALAAKDGIVPASDPRINPGDINAILVRLEPEPPEFVTGVVKLQFEITYPEFVKDVIRHQYKATYATAIGRHSSLDPAVEEVAGIPDLLRIISGVVVVAAFPLIALIAAMVAHERQREIGLLRSMGAKRKLIALLVIAESLFLALAGGVVGVTASIVIFAVLNLSGILNSALHVSFRFPTLAETGVIAGFALVVVAAIGSLASLYPAYQSSRMNPYNAILWEGQYQEHR